MNHQRCHLIEAYPMKLDYPGAFHPNVEREIKKQVGTDFCIHLFSGDSTIGDVRIDIENPNATQKENVYDFIQKDYAYPLRDRKLILLADPDYEIQRKGTKLKIHGIKDSLAGNVLAQKLLIRFIQNMKFHKIILLDQCSPKIPGYSWDFKLVKNGGWKTVRVLNIYERMNGSVITDENNGDVK